MAVDLKTSHTDTQHKANPVTLSERLTHWAPS